MLLLQTSWRLRQFVSFVRRKESEGSSRRFAIHAMLPLLDKRPDRAQERTNEVGLAGHFVKGMYAPVDASASQLIVGSREMSKG
jgi:hypothetical protein